MRPRGPFRKMAAGQHRTGNSSEVSTKTSTVNDLNPAALLAVAEVSDDILLPPERRAAPRIYDPFPVVVQGIDLSGRAFEAVTALDNISADGLYLRLMTEVGEGAKLYLVLTLAPALSPESKPSSVAVRGEVIRVEPKPGSAFGVAVRIRRHRFK